MRALVALILCVSLGAAPPDRRTPPSPETLAATLRERGEYASAEQLLRAGLAGASVGAEERAAILNMLGDMMREEGRSAQSRRFFEDALRLPGVSWKRLSESHIGLADLDRDNKLWDDSVSHWNAVARLAQEHNETALEAVAWRGLGATWLDQGDVARAEPLLRRALFVFERDPGLADQAASTQSYVGQLYLAEHKPALAEDALTRAILQEERTLGCMHPQVALLLEMMGDSAALRNRPEAARGYYERAARIMAGKFGENSLVAGAVFANWALAEQRAGDPARAAEEYGKASAILRAAGPDAHGLCRVVMERYAQVLRSLHRAREAHAVLAEVKSFREE